MNYSLIIGLILFLFSCKSPEVFTPGDSEYSDCVSTYVGNPRNRSNLHHRRYYDSIGNLKELVSFGADVTVTKFLYDENQLLTEKYRCLRNCGTGIRTISKYDSLNRLVGYFVTYDSTVDIDSCTVQQCYFYDDQNRVVEERKNFARYPNYRKHIQYANGRKWRELETNDSDTISSRFYYYDDEQRLSYVYGNDQYTTEYIEYYSYDSSGKLIEKKSVSKNRSFERKVYNPKHQRILYFYDSSGKLIKETIFSSNGKSNYSKYYLYERNN